MDLYTNFALRGKKYFLRGYDDESDQPIKEVFEPRVTFYSKTGSELSKYTSLDSQPLYELGFESLKAARDHANDTRGLFGNLRYEYSILNDLFPTLNLESQKKVRILYIDIECEAENGFPNVAEANEKVNCVTAVYNDQVYTFSTLPEYQCNDPDVRYLFCKDEITLFKALKHLFRLVKPDVLSGYNIRLFDLPYLVNRSVQLFDGLSWAKETSYFGFVNEMEVNIFNRAHTIYELGGISTLDYYDLYRHFAVVFNKKQPIYSLDYICKEELGESKIPYTGSFKSFYKTQPQKFVEYNIQDTRLVSKLDKKLHYIGLTMMLAYKSKVGYIDTFAQIRMWETMIYNELKNDYGIMGPCKLKDHAKKDEPKIKGAFVAHPVPGLYEWITTFDVKSLYPSLIMMFNMSFETYVEKLEHVDLDAFTARNFPMDHLKKHNFSIAANGAMFDQSKKGVIPKMLERLFNERDVVKTEMLEYERQIESINQEIKRRNLNE